jgi:hypothetical protein
MAHRFCTLHRIAYDDDLDPTCPQCTLAHIMPPEQLDFDSRTQTPLSADGAPLHPKTLKPVA